MSSESIMHNNKVMEYCRTSLCAVGGIVSGEGAHFVALYR